MVKKKKAGNTARTVLAGMMCLLFSAGGSAAKEEGKQVILPEAVNERVEEAEGEEKAPVQAAPEVVPKEPEILEVDWGEYFGGCQGAAVVYDAARRRYTVYHREMAQERRSPCSTFKVISSLIALEMGVVDPENSLRQWSRENFWNEKWNQDIDFREAFRESCVWYFRQVIDEIGQERMQEELGRLCYGNCDISDWEGRLNTNNNNRALTGFWIESSLKISPWEQTEVMERIFGTDSVYSQEALAELKQVMLVAEENHTDIPIYGKTGMGKEQGTVVDAWFAGFAQKAEGNIYFCVYLGRTEDKEVSSAVAKDIAIRIVSGYDFSVEWGSM